MTDFLIDKILIPLTLVVTVLLLVFFVLLMVATIWGAVETTKHCAKWEDKVVHQNAWTQYIPVVSGKVTTMMPIYHPDRDVVQSMCTLPK